MANRRRKKPDCEYGVDLGLRLLAVAGTRADGFNLLSHEYRYRESGNRSYAGSSGKGFLWQIKPPDGVFPPASFRLFDNRR
jgi:hypothetical protein